MVPTPTKSTTAVVMVCLIFGGDNQIAHNRNLCFSSYLHTGTVVAACYNILGKVFVSVVTMIYFWKRNLLVHGRERECV